MSDIQRFNDSREQIVLADRLRYQNTAEPLGDFALWNGQFSQGPDGQNPAIEGWENHANAGETIDRVTTAPWAGSHHVRGLAVAGAPGYLVSQRYLPVSEDQDYYLAWAMRADNVATTVRVGVECYTAAKVLIGTVWVFNAAVGSVTWIRLRRRFGPNADVAMPAGTRWVRIKFDFNDTGVASYVYIDDAQCGQMRAAMSPTISLTSDFVRLVAFQQFTLQAATLFAATQFSLTLEEAGYIWCWWSMATHNRTAIRAISHVAYVYTDGIADTTQRQQGSAVTFRRQTMALQHRTAILARGAHTVDLRMWVTNAGDTIRCEDLVGVAFYTRAY